MSSSFGLKTRKGWRRILIRHLTENPLEVYTKQPPILAAFSVDKK
jgi:hypothetical protein